MSDSLLTARELGAYLGLSASTILDRWERGDLPGFRLWGKKGGPVRFRLSEIEAQLEGWRVNGPDDGAGRLHPSPTNRPARRLVYESHPSYFSGGEDDDV